MPMTVRSWNKVALAQKAVHEVATELAEAAVELTYKEVLRLLNLPGQGKQYRGLPNRSAKAYAPPAKQYGSLIASIQREYHPAAMEGSVWSDHPLIFVFEMGTSKEPPHPFFSPAINVGEKIIRNSHGFVQARLRKL